MTITFLYFVDYPHTAFPLEKEKCQQNYAFFTFAFFITVS